MKKFEVFILSSNTMLITPSETHPEWFDMRSMLEKCPLSYSGTAVECASMFAKWLEHSIELMTENGSSELRITANHN